MKIKKIIDLTYPINEKTPIFPTDPEISVKPWSTFEKDGYSVHSIRFGSHSGTHVDSPFHFFADAPTIDQMPLERFIGTGVLFDVRRKEKGEAITLEDVKNHLEELAPGKIALFMTGWNQYAGSPLYFHHPYLDPALVDEILAKGVRAVFIDALSIDPPDNRSFYGHEKILGVSGVIAENLTNLEQIDFPEPLIIALPLKLQGVDGSSVRAVAIEMGD